MIYRLLEPFTATVSHGLKVHVREVTPLDKHLLELGFEQLSNKSRYFRFMAARKELTENELNKFTAQNDANHVAIGASVVGGDLNGNKNFPGGIARYIKTDEADRTAELAITVVDDHQGSGIGTLLFGALVKLAMANGIESFIALVHRENTAMKRLLLAFGGVESGIGLEREVRVRLHQDPDDYPESATKKHIAQAYALAVVSKSD